MVEHISRAPVAQRIEQWFPKPCAQVRFLPGVPMEMNLGEGVSGLFRRLLLEFADHVPTKLQDDP
jgi:hypothetical protein